MEKFILDIESIAKYGGDIVCNTFEFNPTLPLDEQTSSLQEDLIQIQLPHNYILDIGWYPSENPHGAFHLYLVKEQNWEVPIYFKKEKSVTHLNTIILDALESYKELC